MKPFFWSSPPLAGLFLAPNLLWYFAMIGFIAVIAIELLTQRSRKLSD